MTTSIQNSVALVTGANRGLGCALVEQLLERGAAKVYATARDPKALADLGEKVVPLALDVTDDASIAAAAKVAGDVRILFNNAGVLASFDLLESEPEALQRDLEVNFFGPLRTTRAFLPSLGEGGAIVNVLTVASLASMPMIGGYGASKAAAFSMTQSLRAQLAERGVGVHAVFPGPIDTDMIRDFEMPKTSPRDVAAAILDGVASGEQNIYPDPMSKDAGALWEKAPEELAQRFAAM
jgi:NAD(P)-dependent dehydrogenase (short-subunit alcohol dehydrogenase family)